MTSQKLSEIASEKHSLPLGCNVVYSNQDFSECFIKIIQMIQSQKLIVFGKLTGEIQKEQILDESFRVIYRNFLLLQMISLMEIFKDNRVIINYDKPNFSLCCAHCSRNGVDQRLSISDAISLIRTKESFVTNGRKATLQQFQEISLRQKRKIQRLKKQSSALDEQAYHFELMINRNRPDLKLIEQALAAEKPDINSEEAKDFVLNILKATGIATPQQENIFPEVNKKIEHSIKEKEKRTWKRGIDRMVERTKKKKQSVLDGDQQNEKDEDLDKFEPDLHSIPTPTKIQEAKTEVKDAQSSKFGKQKIQGKLYNKNSKDGIESLKLSKIQKKGQPLDIFEDAEQAKKLIDSMPQADDYQNEEFEALEDDLDYTKSVKQMKSINKFEKKNQEDKKVHQENVQDVQKKEKVINKKQYMQQRKGNELQKPIKTEKTISQEKGKDEASKLEAPNKPRKAYQQQSKVQPPKKVQQPHKPIVTQPKLTQQQMYEQFKKQLGIEKISKPEKTNISGEDSLDKSLDPIAEALKKEEQNDQESNAVNTSQKSSNSNKEQNTSTRPPAHKNNISKLHGPSKTILKNIADQDSIDQSMQQYQSQGTINFQLQDGEQSSSKLDESKSLAFLKNLGKKEDKSQVSGEIGQYSDTFDLSTSQSVFHQLRSSSGMPTPNALRGQSISQNTSFNTGSNAHFIGKGGKVLGGGSRVDSIKFSNYLKKIDSQPPQVEEEDDIDQKQ